jgi:ribonuclease HI
MFPRVKNSPKTRVVYVDGS